MMKHEEDIFGTAKVGGDPLVHATDFIWQTVAMCSHAEDEKIEHLGNQRIFF
jgi:hypothetical protein